MKKKVVVLLIATMLLSVTACSKGKTTSTEATSTEAGTKTSTTSANGDNPYGSIDLCEYKGIEVQKAKYQISDESIEEQIQQLLEENEDYKPVKRAMKAGDYVEMSLMAKVDGEVLYDYTQEKFFMTAGMQELGDKFDKEVAGAKKGDKKSFTIEYPEDFEDEEMKGKKVDFEIKIESVNEVVTPKLTDKFITKTLGYASEEDMREQIKAQLQDEANEAAVEEMKTAILEQIVENSTINEYDQGLYDEIKKMVESQYEAYMDLLGAETVQDVYNAFEMTEKDIEEEVLFYVYAYIAMEEIALNENITVTDEEYQAGLEQYATMDGFDNVEDYEKEIGAENLRFEFLQDKVLQFLADNAKVTEVETVYGEEEQIMTTEMEEEPEATEIEEEPQIEE